MKPPKESYRAIGILKEELCVGDVIFETDYRANTHLLHRAFRIGQMLQGLFFPSGHKETVHAAVIARADDIAGAPLRVVEVIGKGIKIRSIDELSPCTHFVLRSSKENFAAVLGRTAYYMYKYLRTRELESAPLKPPQVAPISEEDTVISGPTGFRHVTSGLEGLIAARKALKFEADQPNMVISGPTGFAPHERVGASSAASNQGNGVNATRQMTYSTMKAVSSIFIPLDSLFPDIYKGTRREVSSESFCSMFIIECMQIAEATCNLDNPISIGPTSSPRSLEDYLRNHPDFSLHIIPKKGENISSLILDTVLRDEIDRQISSQYPVEIDAGLNANHKLASLMTRLNLNDAHSIEYLDANPFDVVLVILSEVLPYLNYPESVLSVTRLFGMGASLIKSDAAKQLSSDLLPPEESFDGDLNDHGNVELKWK